MFAGNDDSPTAICPINNLPHTDFVMVAEQSLIADGEKGGSGSPSFDGDDAVRPEKTLRITVPHGDGRRNVTFWTADPYYRLHPEVANPGALSARLLENPTEGPNFSDISSILFAVQIECSRR